MEAMDDGVMWSASNTSDGEKVKDLMCTISY